MVQMATMRESGYELVNVANAIDMQALSAHFATLPQDPYLPKGVRYKQMVRCRLQDGAIVEQPHAPLFQSSKINPVAGDVVRHYERFSRLDLVEGAVRRFAEICGIDQSYEVLVQPHRVTCGRDNPGQPAIEGFHRDGIDFMAIVCVSRHQIVGGTTQLVREPGQPIDLDHTLQVGEMLLADDRAWYHYTSEIQATGERGFRDVLLLSCSPGYVNRAGHA